MSTYAFSALAFEDIPLPKLRASGCRNIAVLADQSMVNLGFAEYGPPRYAGSLYHLAKVAVPGAFHPKLTLLIGRDKGRLLIGSANLTAMGLAGNRELISDIRYTADDERNIHLFREALAYFRRYISGDDPWFNKALARALRNAPWLSSAPNAASSQAQPDIQFISNHPEQSLIVQIQEAISDDVVQRLIVMSPYWDAKLEGLRQLRAALGSPPTELLVDSKTGQFPTGSTIDPDIEFFDSHGAKSSRFLHAKLFLAIGQNWDHVVSGSMNCSLPALLGEIHPRGNAEFGVYTRVPKGSALKALKLENYSDHPLQLTDFADHSTSEVAVECTYPPDGGSFILQAGRISWSAPSAPAGPATSVRFFDRDGVPFSSKTEVDDSFRFEWWLDTLEARPKTAQVWFDEKVSAPTVVVDVNALTIRTLPPHRGKKRRIADFLDETDHEDMYLLQAINELEQIDLADQIGNDEPRPMAISEEVDTETEPENRVLSYEDFLNARRRAKAEDDRQVLFASSHPDRAADLVSLCLNRLIGLMSLDLSSEDEEDLKRQSDIDMRNTEPSLDSGDELDSSKYEVSAATQVIRQRTRATAAKIEEAVKSFEARSKAVRGDRISTIELVRLRTLLQIILAFAEPAKSDEASVCVLPISGKVGDWPRLIGRLLTQHFKSVRALASLDIYLEEAEHQRVLEYLAFARYAAHIAFSGAKSTGSVNPLLKPLGGLAADIDTQVLAALGNDREDIKEINQINSRLNDRFSSRLGLQSIAAI